MLPPTNQITRDLTEFCAHDSHNKEDTSSTTFLDAIRRVGESGDWYGVPYEMWGEVPLERERLLGLVQRALNRGKTKVSGTTGRGGLTCRWSSSCPGTRTGPSSW